MKKLMMVFTVSILASIAHAENLSHRQLAVETFNRALNHACVIARNMSGPTEVLCDSNNIISIAFTRDQVDAVTERVLPSAQQLLDQAFPTRIQSDATMKNYLILLDIREDFYVGDVLFMNSFFE